MPFHKDYVTTNLHVGPTIQKNGSGTGARRKINFVEGANVTLTVADDSGNDKTDVTIAASGGGGGATVYEQLTAGSVNIGDSAAISGAIIVSGRVDLPALSTTTITLYKGVGTPAVNIFSVLLTTKGNNGNVVHLENAAGNTLPKAGSTLTLNNNDNSVVSVYVVAIIN